MSNFLPKFEYDPGSGTVSFSLALPPEGDNLREQEKANVRRTLSNNGTAQHQFNYIEKIIAPRFIFVTQAEIDNIRTLMETHALLGKPFDYFEHSDEVEKFTVTLDKFDFIPKRIIPDSSTGFIHDYEIRMRLTL